MKIGVFDSGIGGLAIADSLQQTFPLAVIEAVSDTSNMPYGSKTSAEITTLTDAAIQPLLQSQCDVIVLACNTATAIAIAFLRETYPNQKFIGIEPMIKTAAELTKTNIIAVCATPATLSSDRYSRLLSTYGADVTTLQPDCNEWAYLIENNSLHRGNIKTVVDQICADGADVIVLGCTHYHWIKQEIVELAAGRAVVIEPSEAIGRRVMHLLATATTAE